MRVDEHPSWIDSHCHLQDAEDLAATLARASVAGVSGLICIGTSPQSSIDAIDLARADHAVSIWATVGVHPHEASIGTAAISSLLDDESGNGAGQLPSAIVAVGECGLDYYYEHSPRDAQRKSFVEQIALAKRHDLALVIHTREAWDDTFALLASEGPPQRTIIHCFTGGEEEARRCLDLGAFLSFSGIVTFKNAVAVREAVAICPDDRLLVETDAPYLAPVPHRGKPNEPSWVPVVGAAVSQLRSIPASELAVITVQNTIAAFKLVM